ncbi:hypothetical protein MKEN_00915400 [Mycena kentingensis (nom. inval.)]|nr:hypothetical protein MKEN_00915400 [Mycena kentingensis (nom. inval.)]
MSKAACDTALKMLENTTWTAVAEVEANAAQHVKELKGHLEESRKEAEELRRKLDRAKDETNELKTKTHSLELQLAKTDGKMECAKLTKAMNDQEIARCKKEIARLQEDLRKPKAAQGESPHDHGAEDERRALREALRRREIQNQKLETDLAQEKEKGTKLEEENTRLTTKFEEENTRLRERISELKAQKKEAQQKAAALEEEARLADSDHADPHVNAEDSVPNNALSKDELSALLAKLIREGLGKAYPSAPQITHYSDRYISFVRVSRFHLANFPAHVRFVAPRHLSTVECRVLYQALTRKVNKCEWKKVEDDEHLKRIEKEWSKKTGLKIPAKEPQNRHSNPDENLDKSDENQADEDEYVPKAGSQAGKRVARGSGNAKVKKQNIIHID